MTNDLYAERNWLIDDSTWVSMTDTNIIFESNVFHTLVLEPTPAPEPVSFLTILVASFVGVVLVQTIYALICRYRRRHEPKKL